MGAEVVSRTYRLPLPKPLVSSMRKDEDNASILTSTATGVETGIETREDKSSTDTDSDYYEFRKDDDSDVIDCNEYCDTIPEHTEVKQQKKRPSLLSYVFSVLNFLLFEKKTATYILIPTVSVAVYVFFRTPVTETQGQISFTVITSSLLASSSRLLNRYNEVLEKFPLLTKSLTTAIIQFLGDCVAQRYEQHQEKDPTTIHGKKAFDLRRGLSLFADGLLLSGPLMHYCFEWMEEAWPTSEGDGGEGFARLLATLCHVFFNDYIIDSIYIALSFVVTGVFEGYSLKDIVIIIRKDFWATVCASWLTSLGLIPVEIVCFGYLSLSFRVLAMNFVDLLWGAIVSFYSHRSRTENSKDRSGEVSDN